MGNRTMDNMRQGAATRRWRGGTWRLAAMLFLGVIALGGPLSACAQDVQAQAQSNKAKLDRELSAAHTTAGVPAELLAPIEVQERTLATAAAKGSDKTYQAAATGYADLYNQVVAIEHQTPEQAHAQASTDVDALAAAVSDIQQQGFVKAGDYQKQVDQARQQLAAAHTTRDYQQVDALAITQTAAVKQVSPVYQQLQALQAQVAAQNTALGLDAGASHPLQCARGSNESFFWDSPLVNVAGQPQNAGKYNFQSWPDEDLAAFRVASTADQYAALASLMTLQSAQLTADAAGTLPQQANYLVQAFKVDVQTYQQAGGKDGTYQQQATQDAQALSDAKTLADFTALVQTVQKQRQDFALPLLKVQAQADMQTFTKLVEQANATTTLNKADGIQYPNAYEYIGIHYENGHNWAADPTDIYDTEHTLSGTGVGDARDRLANAQTIEDYQAVDAEIQMFITNIQALMQNLNDHTATDQPHQTDLSLMQHYGLSGEHVMVVSLREQAARFYENGKLVKSVLVTTGNPDLPSVPGVHCIFYKLSNYDDISPFPKGSPYYYNPTHINFGMYYSDYGFLIHDAWWRNEFGGQTNLPHYDPLAFNSGSHGCINMSVADMTWVYQWAQLGTPVIVY